MNQKIRVLLLEDNPADVELMLRELRQSGYTVDAERVEDRQDFLDHLDPFLDIILADYTLPQFNALEALHLLQARGLDIPFIVVTGTISEEIAVECMKQGASDYLLKDRLARLAPAVQQALHEKSLRVAKQRTELDLRESEERYRLLVEYSPDAVYVHMQGKIIYANPAAAQLIGFENPQELIGSAPTDFLLPNSVEDFENHIEKTWSGEGEGLREQRFLQKNGKVVDVEVRSTAITYQGQSAIQTLVRDVTVRKQRERELQALVSISTVLRLAYSRDDIPLVLVEHLMDLLDADTVGLLIVDNLSGDLILEKASGAWERAESEIIQISRRAKELIIKDDLPYVVINLEDEKKSEITQVACVPLIAQGQNLGLLCFGRGIEIELSEVRLVTAISDMAANALHRADMHEKLESTFIETVLALAKTLDARDTPTADHSHRVSEWAQNTMQRLGATQEEVQAVRWGALLHDIGKIGVPDQILLKPGPLTNEEWEIMQKHSEIGADIVAPVEKLANVAPIIRSHQEKFDGTGYPDQLQGEEIPLGARVIATVDAYSAMTENRVYRKARSHNEAVKELQDCAGTDFDPRVVDAFLIVLEEYFAREGYDFGD